MINHATMNNQITNIINEMKVAHAAVIAERSAAQTRVNEINAILSKYGGKITNKNNKNKSETKTQSNVIPQITTQLI